MAGVVVGSAEVSRRSLFRGLCGCSGPLDVPGRKVERERDTRTCRAVQQVCVLCAQGTNVLAPFAIKLCVLAFGVTSSTISPTLSRRAFSFKLRASPGHQLRGSCMHSLVHDWNAHRSSRGPRLLDGQPSSQVLYCWFLVLSLSYPCFGRP